MTVWRGFVRRAKILLPFCFMTLLFSWHAASAAETGEGHSSVKVFKELNEILGERNLGLPPEDHIVFRVVFDGAGQVAGSKQDDFVRYLIYYKNISAFRGGNSMEFDVRTARTPSTLRCRKKFDVGALEDANMVIEICLCFGNRGETSRNAVYLFRYLSGTLAKICSFPADRKKQFDAQIVAMMEKFQAGRAFESKSDASQKYPRWFLSASRKPGDPDEWQLSLKFVLEESI